MVNVKLMENRVNSHVGNVMVLKVTSHRSSPGITLRRDQSVRTRI